MSTPFVSICIPAYKAERYLAETLASVRDQTYADWEVIVTEDGSRDRTEAIVGEFAATVSQPVRYTRHDPNRGLPATRNAGFAVARGRWIAILDSDDLWLPDHLARCLAVAPDSGPALVFGASSVFDSATGTELKRREPTADQLPDLAGALLESKLVIQPAAVLFNRETLDRVGGFDARFPICNDFDYWLRCARAEVPIVYNGAVTLRYRKHPDAMSTKSAALIAEAARVVLANARGIPGRTAADARRIARRRFLHAARIARSTEPLTALAHLTAAARTFFP